MPYLALLFDAGTHVPMGTCGCPVCGRSFWLSLRHAEGLWRRLTFSINGWPQNEAREAKLRWTVLCDMRMQRFLHHLSKLLHPSIRLASSTWLPHSPSSTRHGARSTAYPAHRCHLRSHTTIGHSAGTNKVHAHDRQTFTSRGIGAGGTTNVRNSL